MFKKPFAWMSPAGRKARLSVLIFHRVLPQPDSLFPHEVDARRFDEICGWLKSWFNVLSLDEAAIRLKAGNLPSRAACITFDDGYADNYQVALPILQRHGLTSTFFVSTGFLDGGRMWNDSVIESIRLTPLPALHLDSVVGAGFADVAVKSTQDKQTAIGALIDRLKYEPVVERAALARRIAGKAEVQLPENLMMTSAEVKALRRSGMLIGAHTVSHPILARLDRPDATAEIAESKRVLESLLGERIGLFAYPNGKPQVDYSAENVDVVRELGFDAAVSTSWGSASVDTDSFQIPRFTPWDKSRLRFAGRLLGNLRRGTA